MPLQGPAKGGRTSTSGTLAQYIFRDMQKNTLRDLDPREALLAQAKAAADEPLWIAPAYQTSQPKTIYNTTETTRENIKFLEEVGKSACKSCGLKFCTCKPTN